MPAINFENEHRSLEVLPGTNLRKAALKSGIHLYKPWQRVFHFNLNLGPVKFPCGSDIIEVLDGKSVNPRTPGEEEVLGGRFLIKKKVTPNLRLACQVRVNGDVKVRTMPKVEIDKDATKQRVGRVAVAAVFLLVLVLTFALIGLDLVKKI